MTNLSAAEIQTHALQVQRLLEETLDRHAGSSESARQAALDDVLRLELGPLQAPDRGEVLSALDSLQPVTVGSVAGLGGDTARCRDLEDELATLRRALSQRPVPLPAVPQSVSPPTSDFARRVAATMLGPGHDVEAYLGRADAEERLLRVVARVLAFAEELGRVFLGATGDPDRTMAGQLQSIVVDELLAQGDSVLDRQLRELQAMIGEQLRAFQGACETGLQEALKRLMPAAIENGVGKDANWMVRSGPLYYRECWQAFEKRFEDLRTADNVYLEYFDGAYRSELLRLKTEAQKRQGR